MQHYIGYPTNSSYLCGTYAVGQRNTRTDMNATLTTCRACKASSYFPKEDAPAEAAH